MNLLKKLFNLRNGNDADIAAAVINNDPNETKGIHEVNQISDIDEQMFRDEGIPEKKASEQNKKTRLSEFMEKNFYKDGYNDGYDYPSENILSSTVDRIKSDFIFILEKTIDEMNNEIIRLSEHSINIAEYSPGSVSLTENRISELRKLILRMIEEKELCRKNEGMIMIPVNGYVSGFDKGLFAYTQEKMIASSTGLFG